MKPRMCSCQGEERIPFDFLDLKAGLEGLAAAFHSAWWDWSEEIAKTEKISEERIERWKKLWIPYHKLPEEMKEYDRHYARVAFVMFSLEVSP